MRPIRHQVGRQCPARRLLVAGKNLLVHPVQRGAGIDTELVGKPLPHLPVGVQRIRLSATAVLGQHQLSGQALVERVSGMRCGEFHQHLAVASHPECDVIAVQHHGQPLARQRAAQAVDPWCVQRGERLTTPDAQSAFEQVGGLQRLPAAPSLTYHVPEPMQVH